jgi:hypothetical protein
MTAQMKEVLDSLKKRGGRHTPNAAPHREADQFVPLSDYDEGAKIARKAVQVYEKELKKIK